MGAASLRPYDFSEAIGSLPILITSSRCRRGSRLHPVRGSTDRTTRDGESPGTETNRAGSSGPAAGFSGRSPAISGQTSWRHYQRSEAILSCGIPAGVSFEPLEWRREAAVDNNLGPFRECNSPSRAAQRSAAPHEETGRAYCQHDQACERALHREPTPFLPACADPTRRGPAGSSRPARRA